jgi:hypothetical protein
MSNYNFTNKEKGYRGNPFPLLILKEDKIGEELRILLNTRL